MILKSTVDIKMLAKFKWLNSNMFIDAKSIGEKYFMTDFWTTPVSLLPTYCNSGMSEDFLGGLSPHTSRCLMRYLFASNKA